MKKILIENSHDESNLDKLFKQMDRFKTKMEKVKKQKKNKNKNIK